MIKPFQKRILYLLIIITLFLQTGCLRQTSSSQLHVVNGATMGTTYSVKILKSDVERSGVENSKLETGIDSTLQALNQQMSTYIDSSEISLFNRWQQTDWFPISPDFARVLEQALQISRESEGAFDITVEPLVNLWGFGPEKREVLVPTEEEITARKKLVGYHHLSVRHSPPAVKKDLPGVQCDLGAIAKGYAVDKIAEYLDSLNLSNYMVEIGGEIRTRGKNANGKPWRIGIATPEEIVDVYKVLPLSNIGIATSGDYRNYFEKDGVRYSHTIDPQTGRPITHKLASVSVVHPSCMVADAFATAIDVMGPEKGYQFALQKELPVFMIVREKNNFAEKVTPQFEQMFK
ncbi:MAG: FAD:protein FMN transferase [Calditrichia bacterium]